MLFEEGSMGNPLETGIEKKYAELAEQAELDVESFKGVMDKAKYILGAPKGENVGTHELGHGGTLSRELGVLFYGDQVLSQGILAKDIRKRAGIEASVFGYEPHNPQYNTKQGVSFGRGGGYTDCGIVFRYKDSDVFVAKNWKLSSVEECIRRRIKPRNFVYLMIGERLANRGIIEYFEEHIAEANDQHAINDTMRRDIQSGIGKIFRTKIIKNILPPDIYSELADLTKKLSLGWNMPEQEWQALFNKRIVLVKPYLKKYLEGRETFGKYMVDLGKQHKLPVFEGWKMIWPIQMTKEEWQVFFADGHDKASQD